MVKLSPLFSSRGFALGVELQEAELNAEVGETELKALLVRDGVVYVGKGPKLVPSDLLPLPAHRSHPSEARGFVATPDTMNDDVPVFAGRIDLFEKLKDNLLPRSVMDPD